MAAPTQTAAEFFVVHTTVDLRDRADAMAAMMVSEGLAACVHVLPIHSVYRWKGQVEHGDEFRLEAKTPASSLDALMAFVRKAHPYDTPEIIAVPIVKGDPRYLEWLEQDNSSQKETPT